MFWSFAACVVGFGWMDLLTGKVIPGDYIHLGEAGQMINNVVLKCKGSQIDCVIIKLFRRRW